jgi:hypothetical protein
LLATLGVVENFTAVVGNPEVCVYLIENGADIELADGKGQTPLMKARLPFNERYFMNPKWRTGRI